MISPNCSVIMDTTSTTSSYNAIEKIAQSEDMRSNVVDSADGLTESELLEEPSQDPEDEDTLSDDSLRLRLSDDEADDSQASQKDLQTVPYVSSEQTTSKDTAMGLTDSDEKVPINNEIKSSIYKSCQPGSNKESQRSKHRNQILSETHVGGKKSVNNMWRGGSRREHSLNNSIHSPKQSSRGHSLYVRNHHSHSSSSKIPPYFNNHDNFGRPQGYRKYGSNWRYSKGKYLHGNARNVQRNLVKEQASSPKSDSRPKSNTKIEALVSNQPPVSLNKIKKISVGAVEQTIPSLPSVNDELSRECSHLNLDKEPNVGGKSLQSSKIDHSDRKNHTNKSTHHYDPEFASDNWFDEPRATSDNNTRSSEISSSLLSQDSSDFKGVESTSLVQGTKPAVPSEQKSQTVVDAMSLPQSEPSKTDALDFEKEKAESDAVGKSNDAIVDGNKETDVPSGIEKEADTNGLECKAIEESNRVEHSSVLPEDLDSELTSSKLPVAEDATEILKHQGKNIDEAEEVRDKDQPDIKQDLSDKENTENKEKTESRQTDVSLPDELRVAEEPMEIVTEDKNAANDDADSKRKSSSDSRPAKMAESEPQKAKTLETIEDNERNRLLCGETSDKSIDNSERNINKKGSSKPESSDMESQSLVVTKRSLPDVESVPDKLNRKKMRITTDLGHGVCHKPLESLLITGSSVEEKKSMAGEKGQETPKSLHYVRKFFQRDMKGKLSKLKREELEELIIQKLVETITMRSEIGRLREQARISERNQEATRVRCQQLSKQIKDFDMVLSRNAVDRRSNNDRPVPPIKINRSVGLQVNFVTDHGIQSLRALATGNAAKINSSNPVVVNGGHVKTYSDKIGHTSTARRGLKVRSPRRPEIPKSISLSVQPQVSTATPAALVVSKPADTSHNLSIPINNKEHSSPNVNIAQPAAAKVQNIVVNGKISQQVNRQTAVPNNLKPQSNDLIDLTEEEDKNRSTSASTSSILPMVGTVTTSISTKGGPHPRFPRVVQATAMSGNAITTQSANIRVVQSVAQPTPTALVNNINTTRLAYVMQGSPGAGRQLLIAPNPNQIRPVTTAPRGQYSNMTYKSGISTLANGNVRVITTPAPTMPNKQAPPAPLPDTPLYPTKNGLKLPPPPPSLKISKVTQGIVLSWNMAQSENYAEIASYQLYAYQEIPGTSPNSNLWKKVGDVRALPLPMACTLKEFTPGNNYHFAVRAVDTHSRLGQYSIPRNISL